jgi:hypothetical protein
LDNSQQIQDDTASDFEFEIDEEDLRLLKNVRVRLECSKLTPPSSPRIYMPPRRGRRKVVFNFPERISYALGPLGFPGESRSVELRDEGMVERGEGIGVADATSPPTDDKKKPITFTDAVGRKFKLPFHLCANWAVSYSHIRNVIMLLTSTIGYGRVDQASF